MPFQPNPHFFGRTEELAMLHASLKQGGTAAIAGLGGVGKTQTAVRYAKEFADDYTAILWTLAENETALDTGYRAIARDLALPGWDFPEAEQVRTVVLRYLSETPGWLLVMDNVENPKLVSRHLPKKHSGSVLITARNRYLTPLPITHPLDLTSFTPEQATEFLLKRTNRADADPAERQSATELAEVLGGLPLALEQAAAYMTQAGTTFTTYRASYAKRKLALLDTMPSEWTEDEKRVGITWDITFARIEEKFPATAELLRLCAVLAPDPIPEFLFVRGGRAMGDVLSTALDGAREDSTLLDTVLIPAFNYALLMRETVGTHHTLSLHRLVREVMISKMEETMQSNYVNCITEAFCDNSIVPTDLIGVMLPHLKIISQFVMRWQWQNMQSISVLINTAVFLGNRGYFSEALHIAYHALSISEKINGIDDHITNAIKTHIAQILTQQGNLKEAESLWYKALENIEQESGFDHPSYLVILSSIAEVLRQQNRFIEAERLIRRALAINKQRDIPDFLQEGVCLNILGGILEHKGELQGAELSFRQALQIQFMLAPNDIHTAYTLNNLGKFLARTGRIEEGLPLVKRHLEIFRSSLGPGHLMIQQAEAGYRHLQERAGQIPPPITTIHVPKRRK